MCLICDMILEDHVIEAYVTLWIGAHQDKPKHCQVWF